MSVARALLDLSPLFFSRRGQNLSTAQHAPPPTPAHPRRKVLSLRMCSGSEKGERSPTLRRWSHTPHPHLSSFFHFNHFGE